MLKYLLIGALLVAALFTWAFCKAASMNWEPEEFDAFDDGSEN